MIKKFKELFLKLIETLIRNISGKLGVIIRREYYSRRFAECGENVRIYEGVIINGAEHMHLGSNIAIDKYCILMAGKVEVANEDEQIQYKKNENYKFKIGEFHLGSNVRIAPYSLIQAHGGVSIGDNFMASSGCKIYSFSNDVSQCNAETFSNKTIHHILSPIHICDNVWLGLNAIVLSGTIHKNSFIAPNSVVLKSIEENSFAVGNPAKKIKNRLKES